MRHASTAMVYGVYGQHTPKSLARLAAVPPVYQTLVQTTDSAEITDSADVGFFEVSEFRRKDSNLDKRIQKPHGRRGDPATCIE